MDEEERKRWPIVKEFPEPLKSALKKFRLYQRGYLSHGEFRWEVFQHIRREDLPLLEESLGKLFGESPDGIPHIKYWLQDLLNDADWGCPSFEYYRPEGTAEEEALIATQWERHRAGITAVKDYLEGEAQSQQQ